MPENWTNQRIWTRNEVADFLRVHPATISRLARDGKLKSYTVGARRLFKQTEVFEFFDNLAVENAVEGD